MHRSLSLMDLRNPLECDPVAGTNRGPRVTLECSFHGSIEAEIPISLPGQG